MKNMNRMNHITRALLGLVLAAALSGQALAQTAPPYQNGGIGGGEQQAMKAAAQDYNLHLLFSQGSNGEYISDVKLDIADAKGKTVLALPSAGPLTDVKLPAGQYKLTATYKGQAKSQSVSIAAGKPAKLSLNWAGQ